MASLIEQFPDTYRFTSLDVDNAWKILARYFVWSEKKIEVTEDEVSLAIWCTDADRMHEQSGVWPTVAEVAARREKEEEESESRRIAAFPGLRATDDGGNPT